jgi:hypothetical protein
MTVRLYGLGLVLALGGAACLFDEAKTRGLPCVDDSNCGAGQACVEGVCGGPEREYGGDPCELSANVCLDAQTLGTCEGGTMVSTACEQHCIDLGYAAALGCAKSSVELASCYCDEARRACVEGTGGEDGIDSEGALDDVTCTGADYQAVTCVDGYTAMTDCDELCARTERIAVGCDPWEAGEGGSACLCSDGTCAAESTYCVDGTSEMFCDAGTWTLRPCTDHACEAAAESGLAVAGSQSIGCGYDEQRLRSGCRCTR